MDKEKAIAKAEAFKEDWEIDPKEQHGLHKRTGFEIDLGSVWYDEEGQMKYDAVFWYNEGYKDREGTIEEINELQRQFGILYEAGYMPGKTDEEYEEEYRKIDEAVERSKAWHQAQAAKEEEWRRTHPEEYQAMIKKNLENARKRKIQWFLDRDLPVPDSLKNNER